MTAVLVGSTGLVGSHILSQLLTHSSISSVRAYTRHEPQGSTASDKLNPIFSTDFSSWPSLFPREPTPKILFSALGTTAAAAGGVDAQRRIDVDLNYDLAKTAKDAGVETYVLVSSVGASSKGTTAYLRMKGELEDKVKGLGFRCTVILGPGAILGDRAESRPAEAVVRKVAKGLQKLTPALTNSWAQDADVIARAAVNAGAQCMKGGRQPGVWMVNQSEIIRLGSEK